MTMDEIYKSRCNELTKLGLALEELNLYNNFADVLSPSQFKDIMRRKQNRKNKRYRTRNKYYEMLKYQKALGKESIIVFGTCTLNNHYLGLKENTYIRLIHSWLKEHFIYAILNKDFGKNNEREHYHFIGLTTEPVITTGHKSKKGFEIYNLVIQNYKLGFEPDLLIVDYKKKDFNQTLNYLLKLNNHSSKDTTSSRVRIIRKPMLEVVFEKRRFWYTIRVKKLSKITSYDTLNKISVSFFKFH